jgi:hypothetical protein
MNQEQVERLDAIEARLTEVTPGPWKAERGGDFQSIKLNNGSLIVDIWDGTWNAPEPACWKDSPDIDFLEHAPSDIAYLLDLVRKRDK